MVFNGGALRRPRRNGGVGGGRAEPALPSWRAEASPAPPPLVLTHLTSHRSSFRIRFRSHPPPGAVDVELRPFHSPLLPRQPERFLLQTASIGARHTVFRPVNASESSLFVPGPNLFEIRARAKSPSIPLLVELLGYAYAHLAGLRVALKVGIRAVILSCV